LSKKSVIAKSVARKALKEEALPKSQREEAA